MRTLPASWPVRALTSYPQVLASAQEAGLVSAADAASSWASTPIPGGTPGRPDAGRPIIYRAALDAPGVIPGEAAYGGDGGDGELRGARRLGLHTVLVERGLPHTESARADADVCCADLAEAGRALLAGKSSHESRPAI